MTWILRNDIVFVEPASGAKRALIARPMIKDWSEVLL